MGALFFCAKLVRMNTHDLKQNSFAVIIPAAGIGHRMNSGIPKQYMDIDGLPILTHTLQRVIELDWVGLVVVALRPEDVNFDDICEKFHVDRSKVKVVVGGAERQNSIANAMAEVVKSRFEMVLIHDAVRPFASAELFCRVAQATLNNPAVVPGIPVTDTIKVVNSENRIEQTLLRTPLRQIQTPQGFHVASYKTILENAKFDTEQYTDDASVFEAAGYQVTCILGEPTNIKITNEIDLLVGEKIYSSIR